MSVSILTAQKRPTVYKYITSNTYVDNFSLQKGLLKIGDRDYRVYEGQNTIGRNQSATVVLKYHVRIVKKVK